ncbi:MAG: class I SAM-dependent methyltransferase [Fimbriimonadaceae bacterium]|nr:MAG: class I SAM-dependent methyltransferase [Fimbriimonadaceae bacterium]
MNSWEMADLNKGVSARKASAIDTFCKRILLTALSRIRHGEICLIEDDLVIKLGEQDDAELAVQIKVNDPRFYRLAVFGHSLGVAEAYRRGYWEADDLTTLIRIFARRRGFESRAEKFIAQVSTVPRLILHLLKRNTRSNSKRNIQAHYDLGNEFFELFLDETLTYSCGIFERTEMSLEEASKAKLRRICEKLDLKPGMSVVEIGSGWGSFAIFAAREYGCHIVSVTLSAEQCKEANKRIAEAGLAHLAEVRLMDYRDLPGKYDRLVSIEMIEAIGHSRMREYFNKCASLLASDGLMALQAITMPDQGYKDYLRRTDFIQQYVFPGSNCPSRSAIIEAATKSSDMRAIHLEEIGTHYATTLARWRERFVRSIPEVMLQGYSPEFIRVWHYYLCYCEGGFAEQYVGDIQMIFSKPRFRGELKLAQCYSIPDQIQEAATYSSSN